MTHKQKLELTWIGKDKQPQLEPRILVEDAGKSYGAQHARPPKGVRDGILPSANDSLAVVIRILYMFINTRAVPLARKGDAYQGRVFYFQKACICEGHAS